MMRLIITLALVIFSPWLALADQPDVRDGVDAAAITEFRQAYKEAAQAVNEARLPDPPASTTADIHALRTREEGLEKAIRNIDKAITKTRAAMKTADRILARMQPGDSAFPRQAARMENAVAARQQATRALRTILSRNRSSNLLDRETIRGFNRARNDLRAILAYTHGRHVRSQGFAFWLDRRERLYWLLEDLYRRKDYALAQLEDIRDGAARIMVDASLPPVTEKMARQLRQRDDQLLEHLGLREDDVPAELDLRALPDEE